VIITTARLSSSFERDNYHILDWKPEQATLTQRMEFGYDARVDQIVKGIWAILSASTSPEPSSVAAQAMTSEKMTVLAVRWGR